jgi:hypothetical protein
VPAGGFESLRIAAEGSGLVRIDAAQQPLVIRGLRAHQSVELEGLLIDGAGARHPAVLVQESTGPVLFEAVHVVGAQALELRQALAVLLQHSELTGVLTMLDGSVATGIASRVEPPEVLGGSRWIANAGRAPRLEFSIATASGGSWTLLAAPRLGLRELPGLGGVLLLDPATLLRAGPYWRLSSDGRGQTSPTMPPGLETWPLRFQALVHGSGSLPALSNVVRGP